MTLAGAFLGPFVWVHTGGTGLCRIDAKLGAWTAMYSDPCAFRQGSMGPTCSHLLF